MTILRFRWEKRLLPSLLRFNVLDAHPQKGGKPVTYPVPPGEIIELSDPQTGWVEILTADAICWVPAHMIAWQAVPY